MKASFAHRRLRATLGAGLLGVGLVVATGAPASAASSAAEIVIDPGWDEVVGGHYTDAAPGGLSIGQEPLTMASCYQHLGHIRVNYTLTYYGEVMHRVGLHELNTGAVAHDVWQVEFVNGGSYPTRAVAPPSPGTWAPFVEVWVLGPAGWESASLYIPVDYSFSACQF